MEEDRAALKKSCSLNVPCGTDNSRYSLSKLYVSLTTLQDALLLHHSDFELIIQTSCSMMWTCLLQICDKAFKRRHHLQEHSFIHSANKPFKCDACGKTFNQKISLTKHLPCRAKTRGR